MEKLSSENIRFIDTYLKKSGMEFFDIRMEMVDHVASEIEARQANGEPGEFYDIFKVYMAKNKKPLLEGMKKQRKDAEINVFKKVIWNLCHPMPLIFGGLLALGSHWLVQFSVAPSTVQAVHFVLMILLLVVVSYSGFGKVKYSFAIGVMRCIWLLYFLLVMNDNFFQFYNFWNYLVLFVYESAVLKTILDLRGYYRNKYSVV